MAIDISATTRRIVYTGSAGVGPYAFAFEVLAQTDIAVYFDNTLLTLTTDYTVALNPDGTGSVTIVVGTNVPTTPTASNRITIVGNRTVERTTDFTTGGPLFATSLNDEFDSQTIFVQQVLEQSDRSLRAPNTDPTTINMTLPINTVRANKTLAFDADGNPTTGEIVGNWRGDWAASTAYSKRDLVKDTTNNNVYICVTAHTSSGALPLTTNADYAKWNLMVDAASATASAAAAAASEAAAATSESNAATSESNAATSESNASTSASNASTSASNASTSASNAATSASNAAASESAAAAYVDNFDDTYLGAKTSDPTLDNDGDPLADGALYFNTTDDVMKVYDLGTTTWYQLTPTVSNQTNINTVAGISGDVTTVAGISANVTTVAGNSANVTTVAGVSGNVTTVAGISADVTTVASDTADIGTVATNIANVNTTATNIANVNTVGGISANVTTVAGNSANINTVAGISADVTSVAGISSDVTTAATNIVDISNFADVYYGPSATAPTTRADSSALQIGDLYFDTATSTMKVYGSGGWVAAGSSVNGTADRYIYNVSASTTTVTGADANGNTLAYDAGFVDVYLNGVKMVNGTDITATSGTSIVFATAIGTSGTDTVDIIAYGTFTLANFSIGDAANVDLGGLATNDLLQYNGSNFVPKTFDEVTPSQATNSGKYLTTDGTNSSWGTVTTYSLPSQTGNNGKYLTTDGTNESWGTIVSFDAGTLMLFQQTAAPTGWTKQATHNNKALRVVSGTASSGGTVAFTSAFTSQTPTGSVTITSVTGSAGATTLSTSQIPAHSHTRPQSNTVISSPNVVGVQNGSNLGGAIASNNTGGGGSHTHPFSFSSGAGTFSGSAIDLAVQYVDLIIASKD